MWARFGRISIWDRHGDRTKKEWSEWTSVTYCAKCYSYFQSAPPERGVAERCCEVSRGGPESHNVHDSRSRCFSSLQWTHHGWRRFCAILISRQAPLMIWCRRNWSIFICAPMRSLTASSRSWLWTRCKRIAEIQTQWSGGWHCGACALCGKEEMKPSHVKVCPIWLSTSCNRSKTDCAIRVHTCEKQLLWARSSCTTFPSL